MSCDPLGIFASHNLQKGPHDYDVLLVFRLSTHSYNYGAKSVLIWMFLVRFFFFFLNLFRTIFGMELQHKFFSTKKGNCIIVNVKHHIYLIFNPSPLPPIPPPPKRIGGGGRNTNTCSWHLATNDWGTEKGIKTERCWGGGGGGRKKKSQDSEKRWVSRWHQRLSCFQLVGCTWLQNLLQGFWVGIFEWFGVRSFCFILFFLLIVLLQPASHATMMRWWKQDTNCMKIPTWSCRDCTRTAARPT